MESHRLTPAGPIQNSSSANSLNNNEVKYRFPGEGSSSSPGSERGYKQTGAKLWLHRLGRVPTIILILVLACSIIIILTLTLVLIVRGTCSDASSNSSSLHPQESKVVYKDRQGRIFPYQQIRLPSNMVIPVTYDIFLHPNLTVTDPFYTGTVTILCSCLSSTDFVIVHSLDLNITEVHINSEERPPKWIPAKEFLESTKLEQIFIRMKTPCTVGRNFSVKIAFIGELTKKHLMGFYLSDYTKDGVSMRLGATNMEPTSARRAFPCFDEPEMKATFALKMKRDADHYSLFNMPLIKTVRLSDGYYMDEYERSVIMSTYLVAFMILPNDYKNTSVKISSGGKNVTISVFAPSESIRIGKFALKVAKVALPFFENFFSMKYPLPKLDMIGLPDFRGGAMENWGLVTYRFLALLHDEKQSSVKHRQSVAEIICHEIAHQWFGNIVTMKWWNDLWLNEGFAAFAQYLGADVYDSSWHVMDQFDVYHLETAISADSLIHSHPIDVKVENPHEIDSIFDEISYFKGSSLVRMLQTTLGWDSLKAGLSIYLNRFAYRNAESSDLWAALSEGYAKTRGAKTLDSPINDLKRVMVTWTQQMNYPLVTVILRGNRLILKQKRFLLFKNATSYWKSKYHSAYDYHWSIPIYMITDQTIKQPRTYWLDMKSEVEITLDHTPNWVKANFRRTGYYRVNYDAKTWKMLSEKLLENHKFLNASDRAGLISDVFNLARSGDLDIGTALDLCRYLFKERDLGPWGVFQQNIVYVGQQLSSNYRLLKKLKMFVRELVKPFFYSPSAPYDAKTNLDFDSKSKSHQEVLKRLQIYRLAVLGENEDVINHLMKLFTLWRVNKTDIDPNLRTLVFTVGISRSDTKTWNYVWNKYRNVERRAAKDMLYAMGVALTASRDVSVLRKLLQSTLDRRLIRRQDSIFILSSLSKKPAGRDLTWLFIRRNWHRFYRDFGDSGFQMPMLIRVCSTFNTEADFKSVSEFFARNPQGAGKRAALQTLEQILSNIQWRQDNYETLQKWLDNRYPDSDTRTK